MNIAMPDADYGVLTAPDTVRIERLLPGPIERVWQYLTDSELRAKWFAGGPIEAQAGGRIDLLFRNSSLTENDDAPPPDFAKNGLERRMGGAVTQWDPPRVLGFTFGDGESPSHVRFELSPQGDQVRLQVTHSRVATADSLRGFSAGWHTHLDILRDRMTDATPAGFWRTHARLVAEYAQRYA
ncbi:MAG: SRPBCC family protein [Arenimonas sp.]